MSFKCRGCGSQNVEIFLDLGDQPHCNRLIHPDVADHKEPYFPLRTGFCHNCTMVQIDHTIPKESMFSDYPYVSGTTKTLVAHFAETAERLVKTHDLRASDLVVDIGSNDGTWLKQYAPFGLKALGVEPASNVAQLATDAGVVTWNRFFNEETAEAILAEHGPAKLITAAGVFFHLEELHSVVRGIKKLLHPNGIFCVQAIYLGGMLENLAFDQIYHEHLCYYTLKSLNALLMQHGLEGFDAKIVPIHGGSIELHAGHYGAHSIEDSLTKIAASEAERGYDKFETYTNFADRVWQLKTRLTEILEDFARDGKTVYAYGAPAKGATLLNSFGIDTRLVEKAAEKSALKFGLAIPGVRIPIEDEATLTPPDAYLMLAWNFLDEFLVKESNYLEAGGKFIVPIPKVAVVGADDLLST
ncbi:MAG: class I SAM-dependent methyltransferase [Pseudomonadota bacterium]